MWHCLVHFMSYRKTCHKNGGTSWQVILSRASVAERKRKMTKEFFSKKGDFKKMVLLILLYWAVIHLQSS